MIAKDIRYYVVIAGGHEASDVRNQVVEILMGIVRRLAMGRQSREKRGIQGRYIPQIRLVKSKTRMRCAGTGASIAQPRRVHFAMIAQRVELIGKPQGTPSQ